MTVAKANVLSAGFIWVELGIGCGCIGHIPRGITSNSRTGMIVAYNSIYCEVVTFGKGGGKQDIGLPF